MTPSQELHVAPQEQSSPDSSQVTAIERKPPPNADALRHLMPDRFGPPTQPGDVGTLGRYRVRRELGRGGMGAVYLGLDDQLERKVALKVILPEFGIDPSVRERFLREARAAAKVKSDHVVTIFDVGVDRDVPFIAMEFLQGATLADYVKKRGRVGVEQALRVTRETAVGLQAAHDLGLVHRDVKPANLWLEAPKGRVKILDFGLARSGKENAQITQSGMAVGTPAYMSPEQARNQPLDPRSDLFSLGVVLYQLLTGQLPFRGDTAMSLLTSLAVDEPPPVRELNSTVSEGIAAAVHRLLE
jgi:serine/threonine protein kinase